MDTSKQERFAGRFTEWEPLGEGAEGRLYRVRDRWTGRMAALKAVSGETETAGLLHEFELLSRLRHPCLIESTDLVRDGAGTAHLLEYVPAVDPFRLWEEGGEEAVWSALTQALRGLTYLHRHGFVHGDVAPGNILVWKEGDRWRAKVADLGLTLPAAAAAEAGIRGTPGFLAPEVARGEGGRPETDLYALAATAVAWIDGQGPWEGLTPAQQLQAVAAGADVPRPRRRVSASLETLIQSLGGGAPPDRRVRDWSELREQSFWGPPVLSGTIFGTDASVASWSAWLSDLPEGGGASLTLGGLVGAGKKTALRALARHLVGRGWVTLSDVPMDAMQDWLDAGSAAPDPVALSQALTQRFSGEDVVILVPDPPQDLEARLLQAFLASRSESRVRTVVLIGQDSIHLAMPPSTRQKSVEWKLSPEAIEGILEDLYPPEDIGSVARPGVVADTPLALLVRKKVDSLGGTAVAEAEGLNAEIARLWSDTPPEVREALGVLALSEGEWFVEDLAVVLGWNEADRDQVLETLTRIGLSRRSYGRRGIRESLPDWLIKETIARHAVDLFPAEALERIASTLDSGTVRTLDLGMVRHLQSHGLPIERYARKTLDRALQLGKFEAVLKLWDPDGLYSPEVLERFHRAAQVLGRYRDEVAILRARLAPGTGGGQTALRQALAVALGNLGRWSECIEVCEGIRKSDRPERRLWAGLQIAECLWQSGAFAESDEAYEAIHQELTDQDESEWLRYAVGRARQSGQRGRVDEADEYLKLAVEKVGVEVCENHPMFLNTRAAFLIERGNYPAAEKLMGRGIEVARNQRVWDVYTMIAHKASAAAYGMGNMSESVRLARDGVSTSLALGSPRITAMLSSMIGYPETVMLRLKSALDRSVEIRGIAEDLDDKNLVIQSLRLRAFVSAHGGIGSILEATTDEINALAGSIGERESRGYADHCRGIYYLGDGDYEKAVHWFEEALEQMSRLGHNATVLKVRVLLVLAKYRAGLSVMSEELLMGVLSDISESRYPMLEPIIKLAMAETGSRGVGDPDDPLEALWESGRYLDVVDWVPVLGDKLAADASTKWKQRIVSVIQRAANSMDDAGVRSEFLRRGATSRGLKYAMS